MIIIDMIMIIIIDMIIIIIIILYFHYHQVGHDISYYIKPCVAESIQKIGWLFDRVLYNFYTGSCMGAMMAGLSRMRHHSFQTV